MQEFDRITFAPDRMGGRACIRDTRVTVSLLVNLVANGMSPDAITDAYPYMHGGRGRAPSVALRRVAGEGGALSRTPVGPAAAPRCLKWLPPSHPPFLTHRSHEVSLGHG
jgi:hypothetical protein